MQCKERRAAETIICLHGMGVSRNRCQMFIWVVKRYGVSARKKSNGKLPITKKTMTTAIVPMIGPIEFSASVEKRNAIEATTAMDQIAAEKARNTLRGS